VFLNYQQKIFTEFHFYHLPTTYHFFRVTFLQPFRESLQKRKKKFFVFAISNKMTLWQFCNRVKFEEKDARIKNKRITRDKEIVGPET